MTSPSGVTTTWALVIRPGSPGHVLGDADGERHAEAGAPRRRSPASSLARRRSRRCRRRSPATATRSSAASGSIVRGRLEVALGDDRRSARRARACPARRRPARRRRRGIARCRRPRGDERRARTTTATAASRGERRPVGSPRRGAARRSRRAAKPSWNTTHVRRITPPTRAIPTSGPAAWVMPRLASGTPPNGNEKRSASTRVWAAGRPITRQRPFGAASAARPWRQAKISAGDDVAGHGELPHPAHAHRQPADAERACPRTEPRPGARRRRRGRPRTARRRRTRAATSPTAERQGDEEPAAERQAAARRPRRACRRRRRAHATARGGRRCARGPSPAGGRRTGWRCGPWVWSTIHIASGVDDLGATRRGRRERPGGGRHDRPRRRARSSSRSRKSALWLTRWPATTTLPTSPGIAVPGQWPGPRSSVDRRMPSNIVAVSPIRGISIEPTSIAWLGRAVLRRRRDRHRAAAAAVVGRPATVVVVRRRRRCGRWRASSWSWRSTSWSSTAAVVAVVVGARRGQRVGVEVGGARGGRRAAAATHDRRSAHHAESASAGDRRGRRGAAGPSTPGSPSADRRSATTPSVGGGTARRSRLAWAMHAGTPMPP